MTRVGLEEDWRELEGGKGRISHTRAFRRAHGMTTYPQTLCHLSDLGHGQCAKCLEFSIGNRCARMYRLDEGDN